MHEEPQEATQGRKRRGDGGQVRTCHECGEEGHTRRYCSKRKCYACQQMGHIAPDCTYAAASNATWTSRNSQEAKTASTRPYIAVKIGEHETMVLIDSGCEHQEGTIAKGLVDAIDKDQPGLIRRKASSKAVNFGGMVVRNSTEVAEVPITVTVRREGDGKEEEKTMQVTLTVVDSESPFPIIGWEVQQQQDIFPIRNECLVGRDRMDLLNLTQWEEKALRATMKGGMRAADAYDLTGALASMRIAHKGEESLAESWNKDAERSNIFGVPQLS